MKKRIRRLVGFILASLLTLTLTACGETKPSGTYVFEKMVLGFNGITTTIYPSNISDSHISGLEALADAGIDIESENFQTWANVWIRGASTRTYEFSEDEISANSEDNSTTFKFRMNGEKIVMLDENDNELDTQDTEMTFESRKVVLRSRLDADNTMIIYFKKA